MFQSPGFLLDMDGVLVESGRVHHQAWRALFEPYGVDFTLARFRGEALGVSRDTVITRVLGPRSDLDQLMQTKADLVLELLQTSGCSTIRGAREFLDELDKRGHPRCLATSSRMPGPFLRAAGLADHLPARVDRTHVDHGKPAPDIFLKAARTLGLEPEACVVVEDSPSGVAGARAAGCRVIGLTTNQAPDALADCDLVVDRLSDIWPWIDANWPRRRPVSGG